MYKVLSVNERAKRCLPLYPITVGFRFDQPEIHRPIGANFHHFLYISEGKGVFNLNGSNITLSAGTAIFLEKGYPVDYGPLNDTFKTSWVTFDGEGIAGIFEYFNVKDYAILNQANIEIKIEELCKLVERNVSYEVLLSKMYSLVIDFFSLVKKQNEPPMLEKAKKFIETYYQKDLSVDEIAKNVGISSSLLFRLFHDEEKVTPMEYLRLIRIKKTEQLLIDNNLKIYEIAKNCGFSSTAYFCKVFRAQTGYSPATFRSEFIISSSALENT